MTKLKNIISGGLAAVLALSLSAFAQDAEEESSGRAMAITMEAVVVDVDVEHRQVSLEGPPGNVVTLSVSEEQVKLEDINVGDMLVATYIAALDGELREPTEEELAEPWLVMEEGAMSAEGEPPGMAGGRVVRAVCTIEGMNRLTGTVTIKDSRGKVHVIGDISPEEMEGVTLGQTVVIVYAQALALSLEPRAAAQ